MAKCKYLTNYTCESCANGHIVVSYQWAHCAKIWSELHGNVLRYFEKRKIRKLKGGLTSSGKREIPAFVLKYLKDISQLHYTPPPHVAHIIVQKARMHTCGRYSWNSWRGGIGSAIQTYCSYSSQSSILAIFSLNPFQVRSGVIPGWYRLRTGWL